MDDEDHPMTPASARKAFVRWPDRVLGPPPGIKELNAAAWSWLAAVLILMYLVPLLTRLKSGSGLIDILPSDFVYFYGIGRIANEYPLARLYDYSLQLKIFNDIYTLPAQDGAYGPSPYPPYVGLFFSLFARLPFLSAFFVWAGVSLSLYIAGIAAAARDLFAGERFTMPVIFALALAFCPFLHNTFANGQIATLAVVSVGLTIWQERNARPFSSGLALSILAYKPTLLLLVVPMLLLTRRYRAFCGFITGSAVLALVVTAVAGIQVWTAYARLLGLFARFAGVNGRSALSARQYVDIRSFLQAACGGWPRTEFIILLAITIPVAVWLFALLWKSAGSGGPAQSLAWAATLTWTLLLNFYVPVYDSILVSLALVLTLGALGELGWKAATRWITILAILIAAGSWELDAIARAHGIQSLSLLFAILGVGQLCLLHRAIGYRSPQTTACYPGSQNRHLRRPTDAALSKSPADTLN